MDFILTDKDANIRKTIHLIRHGQTDYNLKNIIQGSGIDSDLNNTGLQQAIRFYETYKDVPYQRIYTSKLKRAIQSVQAFIDNGIPHSAFEEFNEINWGIMEGRTSNPSNAEMYKNMISEWSSGNLNISVESGETPIQMYARQAIGLRKLLDAKKEEKVLICMHGRALRSFICLLTGTPLQDMEKWQHSNLCLYELQFNGKTFDIIRENDIQHLNSK